MKKRIREIEEYNETMALSISRTKRAIQRIRLERAVLLEKLEERTSLKVEDSDGTPSPPTSPLGADIIKRKELSPGADELQEPTTSKPKRNVQPRDPNLPKRPQNAYIIFCEMEKERVKADLEKQQPGGTFDLTRAMADAWKDLSDEQRRVFYGKYEDDRQRYLREMAEYTAKSSASTEKPSQKKEEPKPEVPSSPAYEQEEQRWMLPEEEEEPYSESVVPTSEPAFESEA